MLLVFISWHDKLTQTMWLKQQTYSFTVLDGRVLKSQVGKAALPLEAPKRKPPCVIQHLGVAEDPGLL